MSEITHKREFEMNPLITPRGPGDKALAESNRAVRIPNSTAQTGSQLTTDSIKRTVSSMLYTAGASHVNDDTSAGFPDAEVTAGCKMHYPTREEERTFLETFPLKNWYLPETLSGFYRLASSHLLGKKASRIFQGALEQLKAFEKAERLRGERIRLCKIKKQTIPKADRKTSEEFRDVQLHKRIYKCLLKSLKLVLPCVQFKSKKRTLTQGKSHQDPPSALVGLLTFFSDCFKRILTRGVIDGFSFIGEFCFRCECKAIGSVSDNLYLGRYFRGRISRTRTNCRALALLATLKRALPLIIDAKAERKALLRTVSGMCGSEQHTSKEDLASLREHVQSFIKNTRPRPLQTESGFISLGSCLENSRANGGSYSFIHKARRNFNEKQVQVSAETAQREKAHRDNYLQMFAADPILHQKFLAWDVKTSAVRPRVQANWDQTVKKLFMAASKEIPRARLSVIPQKGGRFRVASIHEACMAAMIAPACQQVTEMLKNYGPCRDQFADDANALAKRVFSYQEGRIPVMGPREEIKYYSSDLSQASDLMNKDALEVIVDELSKGLKWPLVTKKAVQRSIAPTVIYFQHEKNNKEFPYGVETFGTTQRGSLLGAPMSFCLMSILHAWCIKAVRKPMRKSCAEFGDDAVIVGTDNDYESYKNRLTGVGFKINEKKTHVSKDGFIFCGKIYRRAQGMLTNSKLSRLLEVKEGWLDRLDLFTQSLEGLLDWQKQRAMNFFKRDNHNLLKSFTDSGIQLHAPRELGGVGLPALKKYRYNSITRFNAAVCLTSNNKLREREIVRDFLKPWTTAYLPQQARVLVEDIYTLTQHVEFDDKGQVRLRDVLQSLVGSALYTWFLADEQDTKKVTRRDSPRRVAERIANIQDTIVRSKFHKFSPLFYTSHRKIDQYVRKLRDVTISNKSLITLELGTQSLHTTTSGVMRRSPLTAQVKRLNNTGHKTRESRGT